MELFVWLLDRYLLLSRAKVVLVIGDYAGRRCAIVRPDAKLFAIRGRQDLFGHHVLRRRFRQCYYVCIVHMLRFVYDLDGKNAALDSYPTLLPH
jgi:hypothetical protein